MNIKSTGYGEDTGWKARYRLSTLNFGPHKRSLNTNTGKVDFSASIECLRIRALVRAHKRTTGQEDMLPSNF
jgi:hypothetical protein